MIHPENSGSETVTASSGSTILPPDHRRPRGPRLQETVDSPAYLQKNVPGAPRKRVYSCAGRDDPDWSRRRQTALWIQHGEGWRVTGPSSCSSPCDITLSEYDSRTCPAGIRPRGAIRACAPALPVGTPVPPPQMNPLVECASRMR